MTRYSVWWERGLRVATQPLCGWSARTRVWVMACAALLCTASALSHVPHREGILAVSDADQYARLARGELAQVAQPFASRPLGAMVAGALSRGLHVSLWAGFVTEGAIALMVAFGAVFWLLLQTRAPRWMLPAVAAVWFWQTLVQYMALPDLWYTALLAVLLLLIEAEAWWVAAMWMLPLMLSRESTLVVVVCLLVALWRWMRWRERGAALGAAVVGSAVVSWLARPAQTNIEHLPGMVYLLAKVPWNFARNVLGLLPWSNVNQDLCAVPLWQMPLHFGPVTAVGLCKYSPENQMIGAFVLLGNFGLLPLLLFFLLWRGRGRWSKVWRDSGPLSRFSLMYGAASLVCAPLLGAGLVHLVGYSWPLFLVATPMLVGLFSGQDTRRAMVGSMMFFALHWASCVAADQVRPVRAIVSEVVLWGLGYGALRIWFGCEGVRAVAGTRQ